MGFWEECLEALEEALLCPCAGGSLLKKKVLKCSSQIEAAVTFLVEVASAEAISEF